MRTLLIAVMLLANALIFGCASYGNQSLKNETEASVSEKVIPEPEVTTKGEVKAMFGSPMQTSFTDAGLEIYTYRLDDSTLDPVSYIPIVGALGASSSGTSKQLVILFDENDVVKKFPISESDVSMKSGIFK